MSALKGASPAERKAGAGLHLHVACKELQWLLHQPAWPASGLPGLLVPLAGPAQPHTASLSKLSQTHQGFELHGHLLS